MDKNELINTLKMIDDLYSTKVKLKKETDDIMASDISDLKEPIPPKKPVINETSLKTIDEFAIIKMTYLSINEIKFIVLFSLILLYFYICIICFCCRNYVGFITCSILYFIVFFAFVFLLAGKRYIHFKKNNEYKYEKYKKSYDLKEQSFLIYYSEYQRYLIEMKKYEKQKKDLIEKKKTDPRFEELKVVSQKLSEVNTLVLDSDLKDLKTIIYALESNRADTFKDSLLYLDNIKQEKRRMILFCEANHISESYMDEF